MSVARPPDKTEVNKTHVNGNQNPSEHPSVEPRWLMPVVDAVLVVVAFMLAYVMRYEWQIIRPVLDPSRAEFAPYLPFMAMYGFILYLNNQSNGLYRPIRGRAWLEEVTTIANGVTNATVILLAVFFIFQPLVTSRLMLIYVASLTIVLLSLGRMVRLLVLAYLRSKGIGVQKVLIVGMGDVGNAVLRVMISRGDLGYKVAGYVDDNPVRGNNDLGRVTGLGSLDNLPSAIRENNIDLVVITLRWKHYDKILAMSRTCREMGAQVRVVPDIFQLNLRQVQVENLDGITLLGVNGDQPFTGTNRIFKRLLDLVLTIVSLPLWLLVIGIIGLLVKLEDRGSIFYMQKRIGEDGREFNMVKFRTMIPDADKYRDELIKQHDQDPRHPKIVNDPRITRIGRFLRRSSLDELPNLFNVLKGEMSLVGPRPPMPDEVALYEKWHMQRLQIIPGMTGLWQVSGRSEIPFDEMVLMDIYYIENWSVKFDLQILLMTIPRVLLRSGAY
jgi:exopolysaccharide biosynthesis polyprenyl glycosylphosphotransferase